MNTAARLTAAALLAIAAGCHATTATTTAIPMGHAKQQNAPPPRTINTLAAPGDYTLIVDTGDTMGGFRTKRLYYQSGSNMTFVAALTYGVNPELIGGTTVQDYHLGSPRPDHGFQVAYISGAFAGSNPNQAHQITQAEFYALAGLAPNGSGRFADRHTPQTPIQWIDPTRAENANTINGASFAAYYGVASATVTIRPPAGIGITPSIYPAL